MSVTFFGVPVEGELQPGDLVTQRDSADLGNLLTAVLAFPEVLSVRWLQYTPYFNDGDPCIFRVVGARVRYDWMDEYFGEYEDGYGASWELPPNSKIKTTSALTFDVFDEALCSGEFNIFLNETFGDHAMVTVEREKVTVEFYDHD